jgi:hypothetical protein
MKGREDDRLVEPASAQAGDEYLQAGRVDRLRIRFDPASFAAKYFVDARQRFGCGATRWPA